MLYENRNKFIGLEKKLGNVFSYLPISPNQWTILSALFGIISMYYIIKQSFIFAVVFLLFSIFADYLNGIIARHRNIYNNIFRYLDTVTDRYVDMFVFLGMLFLPLPTILLPGYVWVYFIMFAAITISYVKAAAKEKDLTSNEVKGGFVSRPERTILFSLALLMGVIDRSLTWTTYVLIFIAVVSNFTALQRVYLAIKAKH
jgi:phosphatidylglycerophosphate synthase